MNLSSLFRAQVQMVLMSLRCAMELASEIDGVIFRAYSKLTRNVAIQLVPLSQLGEELIRTWSDASNAHAPGHTGDAITFLQCWLFWGCGLCRHEKKKERKRGCNKPAHSRRRVLLLLTHVVSKAGEGHGTGPGHLPCPELVVGKAFYLE